MAAQRNADSIYRQYSGKKAADESVFLSAAKKDTPLPYRQMQRKPETMPDSVDKNHMAHVTVHIAGMQYRLIAPDKEGEIYIRKIAEKADQLITQIQKSSPGMSMTSITVLSLVNVMDELYQSDLNMKELEIEQSKLHISMENDKANYMHLREINWELKKEVLRLQSVIDAYENSEEEEFDSEESRTLLPLEELVYDVLEQESCND